jgi:hypothetical protein
MGRIREALDISIQTHADSPHFKRLGFSPALSENAKLISICNRAEMELQKVWREIPSQARVDREIEIRERARAEVRAWRDDIDKVYDPRISFAREELDKKIHRRLNGSTTPERMSFLWRQLEGLDPIQLQQLYPGAPDEVRAAIATMPLRVEKMGEGSHRLAPRIDPEVVLREEKRYHPDEARAVEVLTQLRDAFHYLATVVDQEFQAP